ncbi:MAG TPA: hypothetical protein VF631_04520 [Allosphingosinicella sp.]|jgi:hypothetical protein|uniref:hypothetical protein n=1 Tax=Allosphingosinicella sp. TaxID=2823234 RepID=UPI002F279F2B
MKLRLSFLHIMDPTTREDTNNPVVIGFAIVRLSPLLLELAASESDATFED